MLGVITHDTDDQPYHVGTFEPWPAFDHVRSLFEQEVGVLESEGATATWRRIRDRVDQPGLALEPHEWVGDVIIAPLLHIKGSEVWWR